MSKIESIKNYIAPRARLFRMELKRSINEAREYNRENSVYRDIKDLVSDIKESYTKGDVFTTGMSDDKAKSVLDSSKQGIQAYAKANKIDIIFYNPQKPYEYHSNDFEKPLTVTVESQRGLFSTKKMRDKTIDGDIDVITKNKTEKKVKSGDSFVTVPSEKDETFLRRVYRTISELKNEIESPEVEY